MDLSNLLKHMNFGNKSNAVLDSIQSLPKANVDNVNLQNNFTDGEIVKGEVVDLNGLVADIITESGDKLKGHLQNVGQLNIGDERSFIVKNENGQTKFGILSEEIPKQLEKVLKKELMHLGMPGGEKEVETAKSFIENELPVNKETFTNLSKALALLTKDEKAFDKALFLLKNNMPINKDSTNMLDKFISKEINTLSATNQIEEAIDSLKDVNLKNAVISIMNGEDEALLDSKEKVVLIDKEISQLDKAINENKEQKNVDSQKQNEDLNKVFLKDNVNEVKNSEKTPANIISAEATGTEEVLLKNENILKETNIDDDLKKLVLNLKEKVGDKKLTSDIMKFEIKSDNKEDIDEFLNNTNKRLDKAIQLLEKSDLPEAKKLAQTMTQHKDSVEFMSYTKNNVYLQMPISVNQNKMNGELLVFKDKKSGKNKKSGGAVSAIIGLDTANLGRYETYIAKTGNSIELQFRLENKKIINLTKNNFDKLAELLHDHDLIISNVKYKMIEDPFTMATKEDEIADIQENYTLPNYNFNVKL